jgi:hypothetical protein
MWSSGQAIRENPLSTPRAVLLPCYDLRLARQLHHCERQVVGRSLMTCERRGERLLKYRGCHLASETLGMVAAWTHICPPTAEI